MILWKSSLVASSSLPTFLLKTACYTDIFGEHRQAECPRGYRAAAPHGTADAGAGISIVRV
jgi:hypothetical protein